MSKKRNRFLLNLALSVTQPRGGGEPPIITGTSPVLGALSDGDTLSTAVTWGSYSSTAGTISGTVQEMSVNGAAFVAYNGATVVADGNSYQLRETVTDSVGNVRVFESATQTVSTWILASGVWDDTGEWDDAAAWQDAA